MYLPWMIRKKKLIKTFMVMHNFFYKVNYNSKLYISTIPAAKIRQNAKFAAFWCVFLTKNEGRS